MNKIRMHKVQKTDFMREFNYGEASTVCQWSFWLLFIAIN